jgi:hypothetical protein
VLVLAWIYVIWRCWQASVAYDFTRARGATEFSAPGKLRAAVRRVLGAGGSGSASWARPGSSSREPLGRR